MRAPFLSWMHEDPLAINKLAARTISSFRERNDLLFSYGEMIHTIYMLVNGWVTLSLGSTFDDGNIDMNLVKNAKSQRSRSSTFDDDARELAKRSGIKSDAVFKDARASYELGVFWEREESKSLLENYKKSSTTTGAQADQAFIHAPAFFGETVLWIDDPLPRAYSARCLTRVELITMAKDDVEAVVSELPYVRATFESFKAHILEQAAAADQGRQATSI